MSNATQRLSNVRNWEVSIGLGASRAWCSFLGVVSVVLLRSQEGGGAKAVKGRDGSGHECPCSTETQEDSFLF